MLIVVDDGSGQMCNKMMMQANILASAYVYKYTVRYHNLIAFKGLKYYEPQLSDSIIVKESRTKLQRYFIKGAYLLLEKMNVKSKYIVSAEESLRITALQEEGFYQKHRGFMFGWPYYDLKSLCKYSDKIRSFFSQ